MEIDLDRYIVMDHKPHMVSSLGAILKSSGAVRIIHDLSRPEGGLNCLTTDTSVTYSTVDEAVKFIKPGSFLAKIDIKSAYRAVPIHPECYCFTGLQWHFQGDSETTYLYDCRLPFGASRSCRIFQALTNSIVRIIQSAKINCIGYIDNCLIVSDSAEKCQLDLDYLLYVVQELGFDVCWNKVEGPSSVLCFLGVQINCIDRTLVLPPAKLQEVN
jgi:hypothetical protein